MPDQTKYLFLRFNWPGISWALLILVLSTITTPQITVPDLIQPDKVVHLFFYIVFVALFSAGFTRMPLTSPLRRNRLGLPLAAGIAYGGLIELYQGYLLTNRTADWADFAANCIGALLGWWYARNKFA